MTAMADVTLPRLSDSMEEGTILKWLIGEGEAVAAGDELVEIETDKATMTYEAELAGTLAIVVAEGETVSVGEVIARIGDGAPGDAPVPAASAAALATPAPVATPADRVPADVLATPLARRIAAVHGVALETVRGTGPAGRIRKSDVLSAAGLEPPASAQPDMAPEPPGVALERRTERPGQGSAAPAPSGVEWREPSRLQQVAARRMAEAKATIPHFQVQTEVEMDAALALRAELKASANGAPAPSVNDIVVRAAALALREHPLVNGSYMDGRFALHERVDVGVAVAADDGLVVATLEDADRKAIGQLGRESRRLAERVRAGTITPPELSGATFTVSNLGMFGMTAITPVINPPQAAILGVGATRETLRRLEGEIVDRSLMTLTLSCDHRILNGADGSRFLLDVKRLLEAPLRLI
jgi:pyruvate dehydrogenase E2 component (dihydrolipoamide acetyltransferase)